MIHKKNSPIVLIVGLATGALIVTSCGGEDAKVSGALDETKYVKAVASVPAVTHTERKAKTKSVCAARSKGRCTRYENRPDGFKNVTVTDKPGKPGKSALYCVELDNVGGDQDNDDQWYEVSGTTYSSWVGKDEGTPVKDMKYSRSVHACKH